jgi:regulator of chromosome condensation
VDYKHFPEGTMFTGLVASDSATFVITEEGLVYGWGTFRVSSFYCSYLITDTT